MTRPEALAVLGLAEGATAEAIRAASQPILLVGHGVHTARAGASVRELAELMACPVIQTSGGTSFIEGLEDRRWQRVESPWGEPSDELLFGTLSGVSCVFLPRHGRGHRWHERIGHGRRAGGSAAGHFIRHSHDPERHDNGRHDGCPARGQHRHRHRHRHGRDRRHGRSERHEPVR